MINYKQITIPFFIPHAGCPHQCYFCNQNHITAESIRITKEEISKRTKQYLFLKNNNINHVEIAFFGGSFTGLDDDYQRELLGEALNFKNQKDVDAIRVSTRPDYITDEKIQLLKEYNVDTVELGVQSFFDDVLTASNRGHTSDDVYKAVDLLKKKGFSIVLQLMTGLPEDTFEKSIISMEKAVSLKPDGVRIYPVVVMKNTYLNTMFENKLYEPLNMEQAIDICSKMMIICNREKIPVIKTGLHPFEQNNLDTIVAGPYHTTFGFFVKSRVKRHELQLLMKNNCDDNWKDIIMKIPNKEKEEFIGYKRENIIYLENLFKVKIEIVFSDEEKPEIKESF